MEGEKPVTYDDFAAAFEAIMQIYRDLVAAPRNNDDELFENPIFASAIEQAKLLLKESNLPLYYKARTNLFLGAVTEDWEAAEVYRTNADFIWRMMRSHYHQRASDWDMETKLAEIRMGLNQLERLQLEAKPESWYDEYDPYAEEDEEENEIDEEEEVDEQDDDDEDYEIVDEEIERFEVLSINDSDTDDIDRDEQMYLDARETKVKVGAAVKSAFKLGRDAPIDIERRIVDTQAHPPRCSFRALDHSQVAISQPTPYKPTPSIQHFW
ncbi:hypothetical protein KCV07_g1542, partial [Aureobasidium melanogenum]